MEPGHYLQLIVSVSLILTAAVVAFICDVLKRNNEQLREINIELKIRQEVQARSHVPAPRPQKIVVPDSPVPELAAPEVPAPPVSAPKQRAAGKKDAGNERKRTVNSQALAVMERGAALAGSGARPLSMPSAPVNESEPEPEPMAIPSPVKKDWGTLLTRNAQGIKPAAISTPAPVAEDPLPAGFQAGFHDGHVLNKLVQSRQPVSGLVVSIGVNASSKSGATLPESVSKLIQSLIGANDFAAQSGEDEFLLIYPQEHGASAQRRLSQIAQQLWDFQLRSLGSFQILFSWGGVEVQSEAIEEAIASASERMQETKRGRKLLTMESPPTSAKDSPLRQAV
jgi:Diguanylate cyclase, GGDEF domain